MAATPLAGRGACRRRPPSSRETGCLCRICGYSNHAAVIERLKHLEHEMEHWEERPCRLTCQGGVSEECLKNRNTPCVFLRTGSERHRADERTVSRQRHLALRAATVRGFQRDGNSKDASGRWCRPQREVQGAGAASVAAYLVCAHSARAYDMHI